MLKSSSEKIIFKTILLVESNPVVALTETKTLEKAGYRVIYVNSGEKALQLIESDKHNINLVLLDINIRSHFSGPETAKQILAQRNVPIVFLTAQSDYGIVDEIEDVISYGYVDKSANDLVLLKTIRIAFNLFETHELVSEQAQRYKAIFDAVFQFTGLMTPAGILIEANQTALDFAGVKAEEIIGRPFWDTFCWRDNEKRVTRLKQAIARAASGKFIRYEENLQGASSDAIIDFSIKPIFDKAGNVILLIPEGRDITDYKKAEIELRENEKIFSTFFYENANAMTISDINDGVFHNINNAFTELFGFSNEELLGKSSLSLPLWVDPQDRAKAIAMMEQTGRVHNFETKLFTKTKEIRHVLFSWAPIVVNDKRCLMSAVTDITENNKMKEQMQTMQRLESIGVLAGGIAHDFNNLLQGIYGNLQLAKLKLGEHPDEHVEMYINRSLAVFDKASGLAKQLLSYSKGGQPKKELCLIQSRLPALVDFNLSGSANIKTIIDIDKSLWPVNADVGQIDQIISNLVINAKQAMPNGGTIVVKAENLKGQTVHPLLAPGAYILISITDQGRGISAENLQKIFDPFFTTKSQGSGLGLTTAYSIIKKHQGLLMADSALGKGTTFKIYLPAQPGAKVNWNSALAKEYQPLQGKVLLMDDDEDILKATGSFLIKSGVEIVTAERGEEAISLYKKALQDGEPFDLVIFDLTIREGLGGKEALRRIKSIDPDVCAIVASGYSDDPVMINPNLFGFAESLQKPYHFDRLKKSLSVLMDSKKNKEE